MKHRGLISILLAVPAAAALAQSSPDALAVGRIFTNKAGQTIAGWTDRGGGLYPRRSTTHFVTTEIDACCYSIFHQGKTYLILRTEPVEKGPEGGILTERILATTTVVEEAEEEETECSLLWIRPVISFRNSKNGSIRSLIISGNDFVALTWVDPGNYCISSD